MELCIGDTIKVHLKGESFWIIIVNIYYHFIEGMVDNYLLNNEMFDYGDIITVDKNTHEVLF